MKLVKEHINEAIKHLTPRSEEEIQKNKEIEVDEILDEAFKTYNRANESVMWELSEAINFRSNESMIKNRIKLKFEQSMEHTFETFI